MAAPEKKDKLRQLEVRKQIQRTLLVKELVMGATVTILAGAVLLGGWYVYRQHQETKRRQAIEAAKMEEIRQQEKLAELKLQQERDAARREELRKVKEKKAAEEKAAREADAARQAAEKAKFDRKKDYKQIIGRFRNCKAAHAANLPDMRLTKKVAAETVSHVVVAGGVSAYTVYEVTRFPDKDRKPEVKLLSEEGAEPETVDADDFAKVIAASAYLLMQDLRVAFTPAGGKTTAERRLPLPKEGTAYVPSADEFGPLVDVAAKLGARSPELSYEVFFVPKSARRSDDWVKIDDVPYARPVRREDFRKKVRDALKAENRGKAVSSDEVEDELKGGRMLVRLRK